MSACGVDIGDLTRSYNGGSSTSLLATPNHTTDLGFLRAHFSIGVAMTSWQSCSQGLDSRRRADEGDRADERSSGYIAAAAAAMQLIVRHVSPRMCAEQLI